MFWSTFIAVGAVLSVLSYLLVHELQLTTHQANVIAKDMAAFDDSPAQRRRNALSLTSERNWSRQNNDLDQFCNEFSCNIM